MQHNPTPAELSAIEQIETTYSDDSLSDNERHARLCELWRGLEQAHGSVVRFVQSPESQSIARPFYEESK